VAKQGILKQQQNDALRQNELKWTPKVWACGWNGFPSIIIEKQAALGLDALDMNIILHLTNYWWKRDRVPYPSVESIAKALGLKSVRTVQKRITRLQEDGFVTREQRRKTRVGSDTNLYRFDGLIEKVTPFALEKLAERKRRDEAEAERLARKRPKLTLVDKGGRKAN